MQRNKENLLQKLFSREVHGTFVRGHSVVHDKAIKLFGSIPERLMFYLKDVLQHMGNQILVGTTRCGQFLITYSYDTDLRIPVQTLYKYRLHWWAFRPGAPAYKVAEVQLFDNQDITYALTVGIAQWPNVNDKLIAYGYCDDGDALYEQEEGDVESRRYYITVTTLPSLHDCQDCKAVAESFDEEEMAANWDSCIGLSCLKHSLTIHTTLDVAPPYPTFDFLTNLKINNKIIVNTGNFLHVLSFGSDKEELKASYDDSIVPADICHNIGEKLSSSVKDYICPWKSSSGVLSNRRTLTRSVNKASWLNTIMDRAEKVYAFEESEDGCEPRFKWFRKRRLADKMYEFCSDDEDMENIRPPNKVARCFSPSKYFSQREKTFENKAVKSDRTNNEGNKTCEGECWKNPTVIINDLDRKTDNCILTTEPKFLVETIRAKQKEFQCKRRREQLEVQSKGSAPSSKSCDCSMSNECDMHLKNESNKTYEGECWKNSACIKNDMERNSERSTLSNESRTKHIDVQDKRRRDLELHSGCTSCCDGNKSNECDMCVSKSLDKATSRLTEEGFVKTALPHQNLVDKGSCKSDCDNLNKVVVKELTSSSIQISKSEPLPSKSDYHKIPPLDVSIINPDLSALLAEWEADSVCSLSPKSDSFLYKNSDTKSEVNQSLLELIPGMTISPRSSNSGVRNADYWRTEPNENNGSKGTESPNSTSRMSSPNSPIMCKYPPLLVVLRARNCNQDKEPQKDHDDKCKAFTKEEVVARVKSGKDSDQVMRQRMISGCSVQFDRIYIEVDEEIISTITDIEDDDQGTGFHCALPLSVHGSAYAQLQMVSSFKAERMSIHCERVYQTSLDIEQFCFKAAEIICKSEGFKFWFCDDYDVEIIDICAFNGDILGIVCLRLNAEKKPPKNERYSIQNERCFYEVRCVFIWNPGADRCWLEAYSHLVDVTTKNHSHWAPAKQEAGMLRKALKSSTLFSLVPHPPIRTFAHRIWNNENILVPSWEELRDHVNLIGFRLVRIPSCLRGIIELL